MLLKFRSFCFLSSRVQALDSHAPSQSPPTTVSPAHLSCTYTFRVTPGIKSVHSGTVVNESTVATHYSNDRLISLPSAYHHCVLCQYVITASYRQLRLSVFSRPYLVRSRYWYACCVRRRRRLSVALCIVAKRCVLEQKLLLRAYRKSYIRNRLVPKRMTLTFV